ncbi:Spy/CpxP family protein refolding chaperone [Azospirillum brasilense]|nr:Spy/CpxP family protein refolding chaperone [Azospirillum brasilense]
MSSLTRTLLPAFALTAMMSVAQAQTTTDQDHNVHHPDGATAATQAQPAPAPGATPGTPGNPPMMGQGMGSGIILQPGAQARGGQPGMMMNMDQMRSMMGGMMGQQDGQSGMMGPGMMGPGMMPMMRQMMMGQHGAMGLPFEHVEGRIAFLKAELKITEAQAGPWSAFADTLRSNAKAHQAVHEQMTKGGMPSSWPDRLAAQQTMLGMRLDAVRALEAVAKPLYAVLTDDQKTLADRLLTGPMGMM